MRASQSVIAPLASRPGATGTTSTPSFSRPARRTASSSDSPSREARGGQAPDPGEALVVVGTQHEEQPVRAVDDE